MERDEPETIRLAEGSATATLERGRRVATSAAGGRSEQRVRLDSYGGEEEGDEGVECNFQRICT